MTASNRPAPDAIAPSVLVLPALASAAVGMVALVLLAIWIFVPEMKAFSGPTMKSNTALAFVFASSALWLVRLEGGKHAALRRRWATILAGAVIAVGAITSLEYLFGWSLGIDQLLADDFVLPESERFPGRMSPITSVSFVLLGVAFLVIDRRSRHPRLHVTSLVVLPLILAAVVVLAGYAYGVSNFYQLGPFIRISWPSALCFLTLEIGILAARPNEGPIRYLTSSRMSGTASRRLLPALVMIPFVFGWVELWAEQQGLIGVELGTALFAVTLVVILCSIVWLNARALDAADRRREKSEELFRSFFKLGLVGMAQSDAKTGRFLEVNSKMEEITGFTTDELHRLGFADVTHPDDRERVGEGLSELVAGTRLTHVSENRYVRKDGSVVWVLLHAAAVHDDAERVNRTVAVIQDITSMKSTQEELQQAVQVRDEFLSIASHELKTPLTALLMQLQSVQRALGSDPAKHAQAAKLAKAYASGVRLEKLINDLLDVSRITAGRLTLQAEPMDLAALVRDVVERFRDTAEKVGSEIRTNTNGTIVGTWDRMRVEQVLTNLLSNAIKYGGGQPVDVSLEQSDDEAIVSVTDHGIGIASEKKDRIFERFERGVDARAYGGFGLGLWIAKQVIGASGGSIEVHSRLGQGARFVMHLPMHPTSTSA
jgi:PAS domain S-box-containing protein